MNKKLLWAAGGLAASGYALWKRSGRVMGAPAPNLDDVNIDVFGTERQRGNVVVVSPAMQASDYASAERFFVKLDAYFGVAKAQGFLQENTICLLPENIGTWLFLLNERKSLYEQKSFDIVLAQLASGHLLQMGKRLISMSSGIGSKNFDRVACALFGAKAKEMVTVYDETFSKLSEKYDVGIVAGSMMSPPLAIHDGHLALQPSRSVDVESVKMQSCSAFFNEGQVRGPLTHRRRHPFSERSLFGTSPEPAQHVYRARAQTFTIVLGRDAFDLETQRFCFSQKVQSVLNPASVTGVQSWTQRWQHDMQPLAPDVEPEDLDVLLENAAWLKYGSVGRVHQNKAQNIVVAMQKGQVFDVPYDGATHSFSQDTLHLAPAVHGSDVVNVFL